MTHAARQPSADLPEAQPRSGGSALPEMRLADLPHLADRLASAVREQGFAPDVLVYVERGARLLAWELCRVLGVGAVGVRARRAGRERVRAFGPAALRARWTALLEEVFP